MPRVAPRVPELSEILCSKCGYVLDGLPQSSHCPECGQPILLSLDANRLPPAWESAIPSKKAAGFLQTTAQIILHPAHFYRTFTVRGPLNLSTHFARLHWWIAAALFAITAATHSTWFYYTIASSPSYFPGNATGLFFTLALGLTLLTYCALDLTTRIAAKLTTLEATYRGYRLPYPIVLRGLHYHAAHYFPVAAIALLYVEGYQLLRLLAPDRLSFNSPTYYLYGLCALVVLSAIYLFQTYWIGMRNMMYANR
jgi:hypothetical protein